MNFCMNVFLLIQERTWTRRVSLGVNFICDIVFFELGSQWEWLYGWWSIWASLQKSPEVFRSLQSKLFFSWQSCSSKWFIFQLIFYFFTEVWTCQDFEVGMGQCDDDFVLPLAFVCVCHFEHMHIICIILHYVPTCFAIPGIFAPNFLGAGSEVHSWVCGLPSWPLITSPIAEASSHHNLQSLVWRRLRPLDHSFTTFQYRWDKDTTE